MHEVLVNRLGGLSLPRKSVVRLTDRADMTLDVYRGRKTTMQQQQQLKLSGHVAIFFSTLRIINSENTKKNQLHKRCIASRTVKLDWFSYIH